MLRIISLKILLILMILISKSAYSQEQENFEVSGFGSFILGQTSADDLFYDNVDDELSWKENSLIGIQANWKFSPLWSLTAQGIGTSAKNRDSKIEWLYLAYQPNLQWEFKLGQIHTPFFMYSDSRDVGFAHPWVRLPKELYSDFFYRKYQGISTRYVSQLSDSVFEFETYGGSIEETSKVNQANFYADVRLLTGVVTRFIWDNWRAQVSAHYGDYAVEVTELQYLQNNLRLLGFNTMANNFDTAGKAYFYHAGISYDELNWFMKSEFTTVDAGSALFPKSESYYITIGYAFDKLSLYISHSERNTASITVLNEVPLGVTPELDELAMGIDLLFENLPIDSISNAIGARLELSHQLALKFELISAKGNDFEFKEPLTSYGKTDSIWLSLDWVF